MVTAKEIRAMLAKYIAAEINLDSFEDWIAQQTWGSRNGSDPSAAALAADIELRLSEYSSGHLPLEQMRDEFRDIARSLPVTNIRIVHLFHDFSPCSGTAVTAVISPKFGTSG
jgi:hypothetical protein